MPAPTVAVPTLATGPRRSVSPGVSMLRPAMISTQKRTSPAISENALSRCNAKIQSEKRTRGSYELVRPF